MPVDKYGAHIRDYFVNSQLYAPFEPEHNELFPAKVDYSDPEIVFTLIGRDTVNGFDCFHISETRNKRITYGAETTLKTVIDFWTNVHDSVPVQYSCYYQHSRNSDTSVYFLRGTLESYSLNVSVDTSLFPKIRFRPSTGLKNIHPNRSSLCWLLVRRCLTGNCQLLVEIPLV